MNDQFLICVNPEHFKAVISLRNHMCLAQKSNVTIKSYVGYLLRFINSLNRLPEDCTKNELIDFLLKQKAAYGVKYSTVKGYVIALRYYFTHVKDNHEFSLKIPVPKIKDYDIEVISMKEINYLLSVCNNSREKLLIQILYETGIRVSELANLNVEQIDFKNKCIYIINGKNKKSRTVYFGSELEATITTYLRDFPHLFSDTIYSNKYHRLVPICTRNIQRNIEYIVRRTNIKKKITPHVFRHTFAVHFLNFGGSIFRLQKILGHANMGTTLHYLQYALIPEGKNISILDALNNSE